MFKCDRLNRESINAQGVSCSLGEPFRSAYVDVSTSVDPGRRKTRSKKQTAARFAKYLDVHEPNGGILVTYMTSHRGRLSGRQTSLGRRIVFGAMFSVAAGVASAAQAQVALTNGVTMTSTASQPVVSGVTAIDLGNFSQSTAQTLVSQMPMSLSYAGVNVGISFTGSSGVYDGGAWAPGPNNYLMAAGGSVTLQFSQVQTYFETRWASQDVGNVFRFYNGDQLLASQPSMGGSSTVAFNFAELGFDRVVAADEGPGNLEFGHIRFASAAPDVVPIPLGGVGGIAALLGMFALRRGYGGRLPQGLLAFASGGRRQQVQRFA